MARASQQKKSEKLRIFSERFKSALRKSNLQDNEIAGLLGVAPFAISNWRQGLNMAKGKNLRRLAEVLNCATEWLLGEDEHDFVRHSSRKDSWQHRALVAEKKLADLQNGLRYLLEASGEPADIHSKAMQHTLPISKPSKGDLADVLPEA